MARTTNIVAVDDAEEVRAAQEWFARWRDSLSYISPNRGCGCCVDIWTVEGPQEAIADLPIAIRGTTATSNSTDG